MTRIVRFYETGGPELLTVEEAIQHPRRGEVLIQVEAIGLNRADSMFMRGYFLCLGYEAAGVVTELGPGVDAKWKGKKGISNSRLLTERVRHRR